MGFKDVMGQIEAGLEDMTSLEVLSFKGKLASQVTTAGVPDVDTLLAAARTAGTFQLVAATKLRLDGDCTFFYDETATADDLDAHARLVDSASAKRAAIVALLGDLIRRRIG